MSDSFAGSEIVEIGVQIEINGRDFYQKAAKKTKNPGVKEIFKWLGKEEEEHISTFQKILNSAHKYEPRGAYPDEYFSYMNTLAEGHVFTKEHTGLAIAEKTASDIDAIELGIKFEKESIVFYEEMKKIVHDEDKTLLDQLIDQEKIHLQKLQVFKKDL
jgi:rubrerythrin